MKKLMLTIVTILFLVGCSNINATDSANDGIEAIDELSDETNEELPEEQNEIDVEENIGEEMDTGMEDYVIRFIFDNVIEKTEKQSGSVKVSLEIKDNISNQISSFYIGEYLGNATNDVLIDYDDQFDIEEEVVMTAWLKNPLQDVYLIIAKEDGALNIYDAIVPFVESDEDEKTLEEEAYIQSLLHRININNLNEVGIQEPDISN